MDGEERGEAEGQKRVGRGKGKGTGVRERHRAWTSTTSSYSTRCITCEAHCVIMTHEPKAVQNISLRMRDVQRSHTGGKHDSMPHSKTRKEGGWRGEGETGKEIQEREKVPCVGSRG